MVLFAVGLQKPNQKSKGMDRQECLVKRMTLWKDGKIDVLMRKERMIQKRLASRWRAGQPNKAKVFANLVTADQIDSALRASMTIAARASYL